MRHAAFRRIGRFIEKDLRPYFIASNKKPLINQIREMVVLGTYYHYIPYQYIKYNMYCQNFEGDILDYIPPKLVEKYRDKINPRELWVNTIDKKAFSEIMQANNIPVMDHLFAVERAKKITSRQGSSVDYTALIEALKDTGRNTFFVKPTRGGSGVGVFQLTLHDKSIRLNSQLVTDENHFYDMLFRGAGFEELLIQHKFVQHEFLNRINPYSVNTIRIDTFVRSNQVSSNTASLRMSSDGGYIDNVSQGGITVGVNLNSGRLYNYGTRITNHRTFRVLEHPITHFRFEDATLPYWSQVKELVQSAALAMYPLRYLGWDVAIGAEGPVLIEANQDLEVCMNQETAGGYRDSPLGQEILCDVGVLK